MHKAKFSGGMYEVFAKYGNNFVSRGEVEANDSYEAAKQAAFLLDRKTIGVRPAYSEIQPIVHKFKEIPTIG